MTLSVLDAAAEAPGRNALVVRGERLRFAELAERVEEAMRVIEARGDAADDDLPAVMVATPTLESLIELYALIELRVPVHLLHPSLSDAERDARRGRISRIPTTGMPADERPLAVVYTSGTSGEPKGVVLSRRAFVASARASEANLGWRDDDRWLLRIPVAHIGGLSTVTRCLLARRCVVLADDVLPLAEQMERDRVTLVSLVPTLLRRLLDETSDREVPPSLRAILLGGAHAPPDLLTEAADRGWPVLTTYGLTETCSQVTTQRPGTVNRGELGSGPPLAGVDLRVVDGAIQVRGSMLFSRYFPGPEAMPFLDDGFFVTGDRGRIDEAGNLHVIGRLDDLIVSGGENVDPLEVEAALRACTGVADACVFGIPDREWGERVAAAVVASGVGGWRAADRLSEQLRARLAPFKLPRAWFFVEDLPRTPSGKPDRRAVARRFAGTAGA